MRSLKGAALGLIGALAVLAPLAAGAAASCPTTEHRECYPTCVQMKPDGSDCARTSNVCRQVCDETEFNKFERTRGSPEPLSRPRLPGGDEMTGPPPG